MTSLDLTQTRTAPGRLLNVVVTGEFNSGKSSVVDLLLRDQVLPISAKYSGWPMVRVHPAEKNGWKMETLSGARKRIAEGTAPQEACRIDIGHSNLPFTGASITEIPIDLTGRISEADRAVLETADVLVWCTMAQRAWSLSEIEIVAPLPEALRERSILAITRSDLLRSDSARQKVSERVKRQASAFFKDILLINSSPESLATASEEKTWQAAGGKALSDKIKEVLSVIPAPQPVAEVVQLRALVKSPADVFRHWMQRKAGFVAGLDAAGTADDVTGLIYELVQDARDDVQSATAIEGELSEIERMFNDAIEALDEVLRRWAAQSAMMKSVDVLVQIERELAVLTGSEAVKSAGSEGEVALFYYEPAQIANSGAPRKAT